MNEEITNKESVSEPTEDVETAAEREESLSECDSDGIGIEDSVYTLDDEISELRAQYPEMIRDTESTDSERYSELRAMGLSMKEAYLATSEKKKSADTRTHLRGGKRRPQDFHLLPLALRPPSASRLRLQRWFRPQSAQHRAHGRSLLLPAGHRAVRPARQ